MGENVILNETCVNLSIMDNVAAWRRYRSAAFPNSLACCSDECPLKGVCGTGLLLTVQVCDVAAQTIAIGRRKMMEAKEQAGA